MNWCHKKGNITIVALQMEKNSDDSMEQDAEV
jgi:hypothetical protein